MLIKDTYQINFFRVAARRFRKWAQKKNLTQLECIAKKKKKQRKG
jgi:hypothetical protein